MKSWGQLPMNLIDSWKTRQCDLAFTAVRMSHNPLATCAGKNMSSKIFKSLPLISIMAASTTRKVREPSTDNLALFTFMLPSLIRTIDCGYRYEYVLGFDKGDPFYDSDEVTSCSYIVTCANLLLTDLIIPSAIYNFERVISIE